MKLFSEHIDELDKKHHGVHLVGMRARSAERAAQRALAHNPLLVISALAALVTMFFVPPSIEYLDYFNWHTLACLFSILAVIAAIDSSGLLEFVAHSLAEHAKSTRTLVVALVLVSLVCSMFLSNDMTLVTVLPLALILLKSVNRESEVPFAFIAITLAANSGGMLLPFGNPHNLYLYSLFGVDFGDFIKYKEHANETLKFEYQATLNSNAVTDDKTTNTAIIQYGHNVDSLSDPKKDTTIIKTHNLKITKVEKGTKTPLTGAKFNLYKGTSTIGKPIHFVQGDNGTYTVTTDENGITELVTSSTGIINVKGLDDGDYRLVETEAPEGYNKLKSPKEINIKAESSDNGENVTVSGNDITVENSTESWLPETGGMGTVIFTVVGVVGVLVILSTYFKKGKKEEA